MQLLTHELRQLDATSCVIEIDVPRTDFRIDGELRSRAVFNSPAVQISFTGKTGPLKYPCDRFDHWHDNVRAIALALAALRAVDRYGVSGKGEQYRGWQALPRPADAEFRNADEAKSFLFQFSAFGTPLTTTTTIEAALRQAELKTHPDRGGNVDDFKRVQQARKFLLP